MRHATSIAKLGLDAVTQILANPHAAKKEPHRRNLKGKLLGMLFVDPSRRTPASFEAVMLRGGGGAIVLEAGTDTWRVEDRVGAVMAGESAGAPEVSGAGAQPLRGRAGHTHIRHRGG